MSKALLILLVVPMIFLFGLASLFLVRQRLVVGKQLDTSNRKPIFENPMYVPLVEAEAFIDGEDMVMVTLFGSRNLAYPESIIAEYKVVNDEIDGVPFAATFCDICRTGLVFNRKVADDRIVTLGDDGTIHENAMVMYDKETGSRWPQGMGEAIEGELSGTRLGLMSATMMTFEELRESYPEALVLSEG